MNTFLKPFEEKMKRSVSVYTEELKSVRAGRANPAILDKITVPYYGVDTPLNQVAGISVPEARLMTIQPWDASLIGEIEKAIQRSDIGINPSNDGKIIRLAIPPLTTERREDLTKQVSGYGENAKVSIRNIRRDANEIFKKQSKANEISEDDLKHLENEVQKLTDKYITDIDKAVEEKSKDILTV